MKLSKKWMVLLLALILVGAVFAVTACGDDGEDGAAGGGEEGGIFSFFISEPVAIDPWNAQESEGIKVTEELFDSLVAFDPLTSEIIPAVAESWEANEDATVWTFKLGDSRVP